MNERCRPICSARITQALTLAAWLVSAVIAQSATNLFFTRFEAAEHYDSRYELIGQNGWVTDSASLGGNGLVTNFLGTQAAYIGLFPLEPSANVLALWQPINFQPIQRGMPLVEFSVTLAILDSNNGHRDDFYWSVYNSSGVSLFTIDFFNGDLQVYYALGTNTLMPSGLTFTNDTRYDLRVTMNFSQNKWTATLGGILVIPAPLPIAPAGISLDLGDVDAIWLPTDPAHPGDNFMVFDDYRITASPFEPARLTGLGRDGAGRFLLRMNGTSGLRFAVEGSTNLVQWLALKTNIITDGSFDFIDTEAPGLKSRYYRARQVD